MQAGKLRKRLTFQKPTGPAQFGGANGWQTYYTCYGSVDIVKGQLYYQTDVFVSQSTYTITIRYTSTQDFNVSDRILTEDGTVFEIQAVLNKEMRNREVQILAYVINQQVG